MKKLLSITLMLVAVAVLTLNVTAGDDAKVEAKAEKPVELKAQTHCPVMGGEIDSTVYTDIQGQRVYHCCGGCSAPLKKDPDKFFQEAAADGVLFENIQTVCPVSGKELTDKAVALNYEGRNLKFCCDDCVAGFKKDPAKVLVAMDMPAEKAMKMDGHEGHNH